MSSVDIIGGGVAVLVVGGMFDELIWTPCIRAHAELGIFRVIFAFCGTPVAQNAKITWKISSSAHDSTTTILYRPHLHHHRRRHRFGIFFIGSKELRVKRCYHDSTTLPQP